MSIFSVNTDALTLLLYTYPFYFEADHTMWDLRFPYMNFTSGKIVCTTLDKQMNSILSLTCHWDEAGKLPYDYHKMQLRVEQTEGLHSTLQVFEKPVNQVFFQPLYAPIHKIKVFEKRVMLPDMTLTFDGYVVLYYGEYACLIGTQDNMSGFLNIAFIHEREVDTILQSDIDYTLTNLKIQKTITERIVLI